MNSATAVLERYERLPIDQVWPSKTNPRTHFDDVYLAELAGSIRDKGIIEPLVARPHPKKANDVEIVAGECRWRASKLAGLPTLPCLIRDYTDEQVLEIQLEENIHRKNLTPLEEAAGYRRLITMNPDKHSAATIATRIGMSVSYVWDYLKLNDLIPEAKTILERELMTVGHAILISRLKVEDQTRVIAYDEGHGSLRRDGGLWRHDAGFNFDEDDDESRVKKSLRGEYEGLKPCSVRELDAWIRDHIRFDVTHAAQAQPLVFEDTAAVIETAAAQPGRGRKVIPITHEYRVADDARDPNERTYGRDAWERADGQEKSKTCDYSVLGVVAAGRGYGETLQVCINRDKCTVHFGKVIKEREKNQKLRESGKEKQAVRRESADAEKRAREQEKEKAKEARWVAFRPALAKAVTAAAAKLPTALPKPLFAKVLAAHRLPATTTPAQLPKALLADALESLFTSYAWHGNEPQMVAWAKLLGVDVKACEPKAGTDATAVPPQGKKTKKGKAE